MDGTWFEELSGVPFSRSRLSYGVFAHAGQRPRVGARVGDSVLDLAGALGDGVFDAPSLNGFLARGRAGWERTASAIEELLGGGARRDELDPFLVGVRDVDALLPIEVADFVDFYSSLEHATNAGRILRPDQEALRPNWRQMPVGYHGRAGTVVVSGTPVVRPTGQVAPGDGGGPELRPTEQLDFEAEVGFVVGAPSRLGEPVPVSAFRDHVFGLVLLIDWSARDVQAWEYVPLGPFTAKSFCTSISPWVVPLDALEHAIVEQRLQEPEPLAYLSAERSAGYDLRLSVRVNDTVVSRPRFADMYWTAAQQLAHLTVTGASLRTGDLYGSGTVSSAGAGELGSMLELTENGRRPIGLVDGSERRFLDDGDTVTVGACAPGPDGAVVDLGAVSGTIAPAAVRAGAGS